jgi:hypothetical protein
VGGRESYQVNGIKVIDPFLLSLMKFHSKYDDDDDDDE